MRLVPYRIESQGTLLQDGTIQILGQDTIGELLLGIYNSCTYLTFEWRITIARGVVITIDDEQLGTYQISIQDTNPVDRLGAFRQALDRLGDSYLPYDKSKYTIIEDYQ